MRARRQSTADRTARFEALYAEHSDAVLRYARRRTTSAAAEDVLSETFIVVWRRLDRVPPEPRGWLLAVARRALANQRRGERRRDALVARLAAEPITPDIAAVATTDARLATALAHLSDRDREALLLIHWDGLQPAQAAQALGVTGLAFRSRLHRARRRLAIHLDEAPAHDETARSLTRYETPDPDGVCS
jgi:RNA polymerase sigma factor (sigma-70 family)